MKNIILQFFLWKTSGLKLKFILILIVILEYDYVHNQDVSHYNGGGTIKIMNDIEPRRTIPWVSRCCA